MKQITKKLCASALAFGLMGAMALPASAYFYDTQGHWSQSFVNRACDSGLATGTGKGGFEPDGLVTYSQISVMLCNGYLNGETVIKKGDSHVLDPYVNALLEAGVLYYADGREILNRTSINSFVWQDHLLYRDKVASIIGRLCELQGLNVALGVNDVFYPDMLNGMESNDMHQYVQNVLQLGIMTGKSDTAFGLDDTLTRAEMCVILSNLLDMGILQAK